MSKVVLLLSLLLIHLSCSSSLTVNVAVNVDTGNQVFNYILFNNDALLLFVKFRILPLMFHPGKAYWWVDLLKVSTDHSQRYFTVFIILSLLLTELLVRGTFDPRDRDLYLNLRILTLFSLRREFNSLVRGFSCKLVIFITIYTIFFIRLYNVFV